MDANRRDFLRISGLLGAAGIVGTTPARAAPPAGDPHDSLGVLVDIPKCVGCRKCEYACQAAAGFDPPPMETFDDKSVFGEHRRPHPRSHTTVTRFGNPRDERSPVYVKANCLHCNDPACVSACLVGAFRKSENGPVVYDAWKCMGCRYCMVACPFQIPTYEYNNPLTPQVRKCNLCAHKVPREQAVPSCVQICPVDCLTYGKRGELLELARWKMRAQPEVYVDRVYGEHEAGGTSWLYLSAVPFEDLGFVKLGPEAPPRLTEAIQHAVFKYWMPPVAWFGILGAIKWLARPDPKEADPGAATRQRDQAPRADV